jgi:sugar phosphate isomerase/epimerase
MDKPWAKYLKLGIIHFMIFPEVMGGEGPVVETARRIAEDPFFDVLEVTRVKNPQARQGLKQVLDIAHMDIGFGAQPGLLMGGLNLASLEEEARQAAIADVKSSIDQAYSLEVKLLALLDGAGSYPGSEEAEAATQALVESLKELCAYAQSQADGYTLTISLENFDRTIDKRSLIGPTAEAARVAGMVKETYPDFGLTVDLSHLPLLGETPQEAVGAAGEHLIHVHIGNCLMQDPSQTGYGDNHPRFGVLGGENDVPELVEYLEALFAAGFFAREFPMGKPVVSFEVRPLPGETPELVIASSKRVWQQAWAELGAS